MERTNAVDTVAALELIIRSEVEQERSGSGLGADFGFK